MKYLLTLILLLLATQAQATTWYVRPGGSDGHNCTLLGAQTNDDAHAKQTLNGGLACATAAGGAGNTVQVQAGTYSGASNHPLDTIPSGASGNPFTLKCET